MAISPGDFTLSSVPSFDNEQIIALDSINERLALLNVDLDTSKNVRFNTPVVVRSTNTETLAANKTLVGTDAETQFLDGAAARTVTLPAETTSRGRRFTIVNTGNALELMTVNDDAGVQKALLNAGMSVTLVCDGTSWFPMGTGSVMNLQSSVNIETLAAEGVLTDDSADIQIIDPAGARDLLLPTEATSIGRIFIITNAADAAEAITVKEDGDSTTIITLAQNESGVVWCDGTTWHGLISQNT